MLFFALSQNSHDNISLHRLVCESFLLSDRIDPVNQVIILSYHPHFCFCSQNHHEVLSERLR